MTPTMVKDETGRRFILFPVKEPPEEMVGREYIRESLDVTNSMLSKAPWDFPDFGVSLRGRRGHRPYKKSDVDKWLAIPARIRRQRYMEWRKDEADE